MNSPAGYINGTVSDVSGGSPEQLIKPVVKPKPNRVFTGIYDYGSTFLSVENVQILADFLKFS